MNLGGFPATLLIMINETLFEERLATLERAVVDLLRCLTGTPVSDDWLKMITGAISDESAFLEALEFGRAHRRLE